MLKDPWDTGEYQLMPGDGSCWWIGLALLIVSASLAFGGISWLLLVLVL